MTHDEAIKKAEQLKAELAGNAFDIGKQMALAEVERVIEAYEDTRP